MEPVSSGLFICYNGLTSTPSESGCFLLSQGVEPLCQREPSDVESIPHLSLVEASFTYPFGLTKLPSLVSLGLKDQNIKRD